MGDKWTWSTEAAGRRAAARAAQAEERNARILAAAVQLAKEQATLSAVTRLAVATRAGVAVGTVNTAYGTMAALRDEVLRHGVRTADAAIVAMGLAVGSMIARNAPPGLKQRAAATLT